MKPPKNRIIPKIIPEEQPQAANEVVNYINGKAIVMDEYKRLYAYECPERNVRLGETIALSLLTPLKELPETEREKILKELEGFID